MVHEVLQIALVLVQGRCRRAGGGVLPIVDFPFSDVAGTSAGLQVRLDDDLWLRYGRNLADDGRHEEPLFRFDAANGADFRGDQM